MNPGRKAGFCRRKDKLEIVGQVLCEEGSWVWFKQRHQMPETMLRSVLERDWESRNTNTRAAKKKAATV